MQTGPPNDDKRPSINSIFDFSAEALGELRTYFEQNPPAIPVSQIIGFNQFTVKAATTIVTSETTTSGTYTNLATLGPTITGLPPGAYMVALGCEAFNATAGNGSRMSIDVNGGGATNTDECVTASAQLVSISRITTVTLTAANNTITAKYTGDGGTTATFQRRWMIALKYANS